MQNITKRFLTTTEVIVSKIFPAGFGWQSASIMSANYGITSDSLDFAIATGVGDGLGVFIGHNAYCILKNTAIGETNNINRKLDIQSGLLLSSAAFCSGSVWQPIVNTLQTLQLPLSHVVTGTWIGCGFAFYIGLRGSRSIFSGLQYIEEPTRENISTDLSLSLSIGGATGCFVLTDISYLPEHNILIDTIGIYDGTSNLTSCVIAGTSTSIGFASCQSIANIVLPFGKSWNDYQ
jgi:hypothetical protein